MMELAHSIQGIHHITLVAANAARTARFYTQVLGMRFVKKTVNFDHPDTYHLYFGDDTGSPGTLVTFFEWPDAPPARMGPGSVHHLALTVDSMDALRWYWSTQAGNAVGHPGAVVIYTQPLSLDAPIRGEVGHGMTHHVAFEVLSDEALQFWRERLLERGLKVSDVLDRKYFHSIYFHDPDDILLEIATAQPGFLVDQPADRLGKDLMLPSWLESERPKIEASLPPIELSS